MKKVSVRLVWVGLLTVATAVFAVLAVQAMGLHTLSPLPRFSQAVLSSKEPSIITTILVSAGVGVFAICVRLAANPLRRYQQIALVALLVSLVPNIAAGLLMRPAVDWRSMTALSLMHVVAWPVTVRMLTRLSGVEDDHR